MAVCHHKKSCKHVCTTWQKQVWASFTDLIRQKQIRTCSVFSCHSSLFFHRLPRGEKKANPLLVTFTAIIKMKLSFFVWRVVLKCSFTPLNDQDDCGQKWQVKEKDSINFYFFFWKLFKRNLFDYHRPRNPYKVKPTVANANL